MITLLTLAFFAALALINWFGAANARGDLRLSLRLYGTIFLGGLCVGVLISPYLVGAALVCCVIIVLFHIARSFV